MSARVYPAYDGADKLAPHIVGRSIVSADIETGTLTLSDGSRLVIEKTAWDCCSWLDLTSVAATENIITAVEVNDDEDDPNSPGEYSEYRAWIKAITTAGELNIAEAEGDYSNGYYLHGFALAVTVIPAGEK